MTSTSTGEPRESPTTAIVYSIAANAVGGLPVWVVSAYAPGIQEELGIDSSSFGLAVGIYFVISMVTGLPVGRLVQHWGWRTGIAFSSAVSALCIASMSAFAFVWLALVVTMSIGALSNNSSQPAANLAIAANVPARRQGLAFGLKQAALPISSVLVGLSVPLFDNGHAWRLAFLCASALALVLVLVVLFRPAVRALRGWQASRAPGAVRAERAPRERAEPFVVPTALKLLATGAGFGTAAVVSLGSFLVVFAVDSGLSPGGGGAILAMGSLVGVVARIVTGYLADRRDRRHLVTVAVMMGTGSVGFLVLAFFGTGLAGLIVGTIVAFGLGWSWNGLLHFAVIRYMRVPPAVATSVVQIAMSLGSAVGPTLFGFTFEAVGGIAWCLSFGFLATATGFVLLARRSLIRNPPVTG